MSLRLAPPPIDIPPQFAQDKGMNAFFSALLNTIFQIWRAVFSIRFISTTNTTDASQTALLRVTVPPGQTFFLDVRVVARRTGGTAGADGDSAFFNIQGAYKNVNGVMTGIGVPLKQGGEDQAWDVVFTSVGSDAVIAVIGAANNDVTWVGTVYSYGVGA